MIQRLLMMAILIASAPVCAVAPLRPPANPASPPAAAIETASGMSYVVLKAAPDQNRFIAGEFVEFRLDAWSADGVTRANAREDGPQIRSIRALASEQPGLARALLTTPVGETRRWWFHADKLKPGYPGMPDLGHLMDLTVLGEKSPVQTPADLRAPPADAVRTPSGLVYRVLRQGPGGPKPGPTSTIEIHYSGWTLEGRLFDSSVARDQRASFPLDKLIPGWQEGVLLMSRGDTFRFWVPGPLAYDTPTSSPDTPKGTLVFDVTLYDFSP